MAYESADLSDLLFDVEEKQIPIVKDEDKSLRKRLAKTLITARLDAEHLGVVADATDPREMIEVLREYRDPSTNTKAFAVWTELKNWEYDTNKTINENARLYEKIVARYNASGESLSEPMKRDVFIMGLPSHSMKTVLNTLRNAKDARYVDAKALVVEYEKERQNAASVKKDRERQHKRKSRGAAMFTKSVKRKEKRKHDAVCKEQCREHRDVLFAPYLDDNEILSRTIRNIYIL